MASTTEALTDAELVALREAARMWVPPAGYYAGLRPELVVRWLLSTGMNPSVLADPEGRRLRLEVEGRGLLYAKWNRPKKRGIEAATAVPLGKSDVVTGWAQEIVASLLPRRSEKTYNRLVQDVARAAGIRGSCTPRTLRHTFLSQLARRVRDPEVVVRLGNVSPKEAIRYCRGAARDRDAEVVALMEGA